MVVPALRRGLAAGAVAGLAYGAFTALVGNPLVAYAETFESGHHAGEAAGLPAALVAIVAGVVAGAVLGLVVFGVAYYFLEPAIPGGADTRSYLLALAGFVTVSGAPWLVVPPQPPGVTQSLPTEVRVTWYAAMMAVGAVASGLAGYAFGRVRASHGPIVGALAGGLPLLAILVVGGLAPTSQVSGPVPETFVAVYRGVVVTGQVGLWVVLASAHAWLVRRADDRAAGATAGAGWTETAARTE